jgi:hypothetical protein
MTSVRYCWRVATLLGLGLCSCREQAAPSASVFTFASSTAVVSPAGEPQSGASSPRVTTAEELTSRARAALREVDPWPLLSPLLPSVWPPREHEPARVEWYAYDSVPLPTGAIAYRITGPRSRVVIDLPDGEPRVEPVREPSAHGTSRDAHFDRDALARAEHALVEVLAGRRIAALARPQLAAYLQWADAADVLGAEALSRKPEFFAWLADPSVTNTSASRPASPPRLGNP